METALLILVALIAIAAAAIGLRAFWFEPRKLVVSRHDIRSPLVPEGFDGVTILQFSDTHVGHHFPLARLARLVETINSLEPDVVVFTGDLFNAHNKRSEGDPAASPILARIRAPLGKYAVYGNHDFGQWHKVRHSGTLLTDGGFDVLVNETKRISAPGGDRISIAGLDDYLYGKPDPKAALSKLDERDFNLLLLHEPDPADSLAAKYPIDLQLSGHSHNGQVNLPWLGAIVTTPLGKTYLGGLYDVAGRSRSSRPYRLYVNRGIGTTKMNVRLGSVPELALFTLRRGRDSSCRQEPGETPGQDARLTTRPSS